MHCCSAPGAATPPPLGWFDRTPEYRTRHAPSTDCLIWSTRRNCRGQCRDQCREDPRSCCRLQRSHGLSPRVIPVAHLARVGRLAEAHQGQLRQDDVVREGLAQQPINAPFIGRKYRPGVSAHSVGSGGSFLDFRVGNAHVASSAASSAIATKAIIHGRLSIVKGEDSALAPSLGE